MGCQPPQSELAAALEQFVDGKVPFEYEVAAIFDLGDGIEAGQLYPLALLDGELGPEDQGPIVEPFANDVGLSLSAAACSAATSSTARKALSFLRKPTWARLSSCSMKLWPLR